MLTDRRTLIAGLTATLLAPRLAFAATVTDAAGRAVPIPDKVERVFPAGPPAAILLYTLAPDLLLGWPRANRPEECVYMLPDICTRPEIGRITGRGNTANLEVVLALKPDLILDVGSTSATFVSLAARVQEQTGIPYALLDGRFDAIAATYRKLGELTHRQTAAEALARYADDDDGDDQGAGRQDSEGRRPRVYYARGPRGPGDRARRLDQCRDHRIPRRAQCRGRAQGRARDRLDRAGAAVESRCHRHHRPRFRRERANRSGLGAVSRCAPGACICRRKCRSAGSISRRRSTG